MHFEKLHSHQLVGKAQENVLKDLKNKEFNFMLQSNIDQPFTENDTKAVIKLLKSKKGPRPDRKRSEMLKCGIHILPSYYYRGTYLRHQLPREIILFSIE